MTRSLKSHQGPPGMSNAFSLPVVGGTDVYQGTSGQLTSVNLNPTGPTTRS